MRQAWWIVSFTLVTVHMGTAAAAQPAESDDYTRYEQLAPETAQFRIVYFMNPGPDAANIVVKARRLP